jgi:uncharacterized protein (DUF302 family)
MKLHKLVLAFMLTVGLAQAELTAELHATKGNQEVAIDGLMKKIGSIGYSTVAANKNIQNFYYEKFKDRNVEMISFFGMINKEKLRPLLLKNPDFGAFSPFNFLAYKTLDIKEDNNTWFGHIDPNTMLDIIGEKDEATRKEFTDMIAPLDDLITAELKPTMSHKYERTKALPEQTLTKMVKKFDKPESLDDWVENFVMKHDGLFSTGDTEDERFIIAGFVDLKFEYDDLELDFSKYDAYWVSLLCHFKFSNSIFNNGKPEAGMFAPCSIYFYIPKGTNELHVGYSTVNNWINSLNFTDETRIKYMQEIDAEVVKRLTTLGFELVK